MASELPKIVLKKDDLTEVQVYLHGGTITSWKCKGKEMLFVSKQAVFDGKKAIRGGIPVVFPNFGPWKLGPQHGFARTATWKVHQHPEKDKDGNIVAVLLLEDTEETRKIWNYKLTLKDCEFSMEIDIQNTGSDFEFTSLLHTYYNVDIEKAKLQGLQGCHFMDKVNGREHKEKNEFLQISTNVDSVYKQTPNELSLFTGNHNIRIIKENLPDTVVWNPWIEKAKQMSDFGDDEDFEKSVKSAIRRICPPNCFCYEALDKYQNMVCVEPGYVSAPYKLQRHEMFKAKQTLTCLC